MKHILLTILFFSSVLYGVSLDELIQKAIQQNPSLESISHLISANKSNISLSNQFQNPELTYSENNLDDRQAMSRKTFTIKQKISFFGKRESRSKIAQAEESVLKMSLQNARSMLVRMIKEKAYSIWKLERVYKIICDYEELTHHNIEIFESYTTTSDNQHMGIMSAELTLSDLRIQKSSLNAKINASYAELSYLVSSKVHALELDLLIGDMPGLTSLQDGLEGNYEVLVKEQRVQKQRARLENSELNNYPDLSLMGGYSQRENFDNYWTFGLGMSLPIYGSEDYKEEEARKLVLAEQSRKEDTVAFVNARFQKAFTQMKSAYETYHIINDQALPQIEHMFEITNSSISTGGDLFKYIDILVQKLKLEQKSISAVADYNSAQARISELSGESK